MLLETGSCQSFGWHQPDASSITKGPANPAPGFCRKGRREAALFWSRYRPSLVGLGFGSSLQEGVGNPLPFPAVPWISHSQVHFLLGGFGRQAQVSSHPARCRDPC